MARFLFYCINGTGLGHITRCLAVARKVRALAPESTILFLTSSEQCSILWQEQFTCVKVPSYELGRDNAELAVSPLTTAITAQVFATFRPDVTVVDSLAGGMFGELVSPILSYNRKAFLFGNFPNYFDKPSYKAAFPNYDVYLVPLFQDERDTIPIRFDSPQTFWVGDILIRSRDELLPREVVRHRLGLDRDATVLYLALGGGGNPKNDAVYEWMLGQLARHRGIGSGIRAEVQVVVPSQPLGTRHDWTERFPFIRTLRHFPAAEYLNGFDAAVSATGFNCGEFVHAGLPTAWLPLGFPSTDQDFNAERFAGRGLGRKLVPFDDHGFQAAIAELLDPGYRECLAQAMRSRIAANGAEAAAKVLLHLSRV